MDRLDVFLWLALQEDLGHGDVTTDAVVPPDLLGRAGAVGREPFVLSGSRAFAAIFRLVDRETRVDACFRDGEEVPAGVAAFSIGGRVRSILTAERTALNILQRMCGVATLTRRMARELSGTGARLLDTRKTTPLWRLLEKEAVRHGGGRNHRYNLSDGILIKDNHVAAAGGVGRAVEAARQRSPHTLRIEVEVDGLDQLDEALSAKADVVLLDNFTLEMLREAVSRTAGRALLEASGGVRLETVRAIAETGVDFISCGALTHSARAMDIGLDLDMPRGAAQAP